MFKTKKILNLLVLSVVVLSCKSAEAAFGRIKLGKIHREKKIIVPPIGEFDQNKFNGRWYEIGKTDNPFQIKCYQSFTDYSIGVNGLEAQNTCRFLQTGADGKEIKASETKKGYIRRGNNGKFHISYTKPFWTRMDFVMLDKNYEYAVLADKDLKWFWIMSKHENVSNEKVCSILRDLRKKGFVTASFILPNNVCFPR